MSVEMRGVRAGGHRGVPQGRRNQEVHVDRRPLRLLVVSCQALFAQSLQHSLGLHGFSCVEGCDGTDAGRVLALADMSMPDVVLLDLDRRQGGEAVPIIRGLAQRGAMVIGLVPTRDRYFLAESLEAGITSFFDKASPLDHLVELLRDAADGAACHPRSDRAELIRMLTDHRAVARARTEPFDQLTPREREVLALLMGGKSADEISALHVVAVTTVRTQIRGILGKLGVNSQLGAVALAREAGWDLDRSTIDLT